MEDRSPQDSEPHPRLLVVEPDDADALFITGLLRAGLPHSPVRRVRDVDEAEGALGVHVDCVLLAQGAEVANGPSAIARLLQRSPGVAVVVVSTTATADGVEMRAVASGAQDHLVKDQLDEWILARSILYAVERRRTQASTRRLREAERRRGINARMERALLPQPLLLSDDIRLSIAYRPGNQTTLLGGDFYDAVELPTGWLRVVIGDVSGHGPDEAALGASLRSAWRALLLAHLPTPEVLRIIDQVLRMERHDPDSFVTLCMLDIDPSRRVAWVSQAGHPPPILLGEGTAFVTEDRRGPLMGVLDGAVWPAAEVPLPERWGLLLYTDGLFEGRTAPGSTERLGEAQMREIVEKHRVESSGNALLNAVVAEVVERHGGPLTDDIAACLIEGRWR